MNSIGSYAKFIVAGVGGAVTSLLAVVPPHTTFWTVLTVVSAALTAASVYAVPNAVPKAAVSALTTPPAAPTG